ncbi:hypothetical protein [Neptunitalea lumnitzerae]|uniref:Uncharacterized protein n=1 Tax=Neptunitalea lumnitzerae TaxID=2965509 RepID=A0ABQ5MFT9_9FLAO|nr:hypothetical protein [Neptunitalea sp. Y10]GLB47757.1 hypothetical protein Y10_01250 [Neptunitalea sp. Y10]
MPKQHFKSHVTRSGKSHLNVDRTNGIIKNVVIVQQGPNKNGSYFNTQFLKDLVVQGNAQQQGVKCRFGHPNMCATSLGSFIGRYHSFKLKGARVLANLHLDTIAQKTAVEGKGISMWEYVLDMASDNPDMFGNSIVVMSEEVEEVVKGKTYNSHLLQSFLASDLVDDPAATETLFSNSSDLGVAVTQFLDEHPAVFSVIQRHPAIVNDFFSRYADYLKQYKQRIDMNFLEKMRKQFGKTHQFDMDVTTATGEVVTVVTDAESPAEGDAVIDETGNPIADGELTLKDGSIWVIEEGVITAIKDAEEDPIDDDATIEQVMQSVNKLTTSLRNFQKQYRKDLKVHEDALQLVASSFEKRFNNLAKTVKTTAPNYVSDANKGKKSKFGSRYDPDRVKEIRDQKES